MPELDDLELLRLYVADPSNGDEFFKDYQLEKLIDNAPDLYGAAAEGWRIKASHVSEWYNVTIDGRELSRGQVFNHCMAMAKHYSDQSTGETRSIKMSTDFVTAATESEFS